MSVTTEPCSACGGQTYMLRHERTGKFAPIDRDPSPLGNVIVNEDGTYRLKTKDNPAPEGAPLHTSHFATCPQASRFRRGK